MVHLFCRCSLGDVTNDDSCYEKAIEVSNNKFNVDSLGVYEVSVKATDKSGNTTLIIKNITSKQDDVSPVIEIDEISNVVVGEVLKLDYKVTDNVTDSANIKTSFLLQRGDVTRSIDGNEFTINTEGDYKLIINSYDELGNMGTKELLFTATKEREDRNLSVKNVSPINEVTEEKFIDAPKDYVYINDNTYYMLSDKYCILFVNDGNGYYVTFNKKDNLNVMFTMPQPIIVHFRSGQANGYYEPIAKIPYLVISIDS